jgi:hypothetical protein
MLLPVLVLATLSATTGDTASQDTSKGASLMRGCQAEMRLMQLASLEEAPQLDLINGAYCIGYLNGFLAALPIDGNSICTHNDSMGAMTRAYVAYMDRNPRLLEEDKRVGLRLALESAYPCPSGS